MADQRILYTEEMVGANHPTKSDTLNRLALVGHNTDGTHKTSLPLTLPILYGASGRAIAYTSAAGSEVTGVDAGAAALTLHRPGAYAVNFGLDTDNILKVGGFSMGAVAYAILHSNNFTSYTSRSKIGTFTRDLTAASGDVAYTGVGFQPRAIFFLGYRNTSPEANWGFSDENKGGGYSSVLGTTPYYFGGDVSIMMQQSGGHSQQAVVKSYDSDGFTLTWTKTSTPTGTANFKYIAFR